MTNVEVYKTYQKATQAALDAKDLLSVLRKEQEQAGERAKRETAGTFQEKLVAIRAIAASYQQRIAQVEEEIKKQQSIADENYDIWQGLK